jgi:nitrite reductase/ring-hydroxylating ferredoxin subunit
MSRVETEWIEFASTAELHDKKVIVKWIANHEVAVTFRDGFIRAFSNVCPHKGGPLHEGPWTSDGQIRCPWHGYQFDLKTGRCLGRPDLTVRLFHWREQDGKILITFGSAKP